MNKRSTITLFSLLALITAFGLTFVGCDTPVQEVEGTVGIKANKSPAPGNVSVSKVGTDIVIKFDTVDNVTSYPLFVKQAGTTFIRQMSGLPMTIDGSKITITVAIATLASNYGIVAGDWEIGVQSSRLITSSTMDLPSDIVWKSVTI